MAKNASTLSTYRAMRNFKEGRIREKRFCEKNGKEVPYEHTIKGYELDEHRNDKEHKRPAKRRARPRARASASHG